MFVKKILITFTALFVVSISVHATTTIETCQITEGTMIEYFCKRYVRFNYLSAIYDIDFNQVQSIVHDLHAHQSWKYGPTQKGSWGKNHYWVFFKNGQWLIFDSDIVMTSWKDYKVYLSKNPKYLSIP